MIFRVECNKTLYVQARDVTDAEQVATRWLDDEDSEPVCFAVPVSTIGKVDEGWQDSLPWGGDGESTIRQILGAGK